MFWYNNFGTDYFIMNDLILKFKEEYCDLDSGVLLVFLKNLINMSILVGPMRKKKIFTTTTEHFEYKHKTTVINIEETHII